MFGRLFAGMASKKVAYRLYSKLVEQARQPAFYTYYEVEDTLDGRFDMILLHMFLLQNRLGKDGDETAKLRQQVQEAMIADMDRSLREMGVGDMGIGREVKKMGVAWFGRLKAYGTALEAEDVPVALSEAIRRNLYKKEEAPKATHMASYMLAAHESLLTCSLDELRQVSFEFPVPRGER